MFKRKRPIIAVLRQLGGIGDVLCLSPVFRGLREKYPKHEIVCVTGNVYLAGALTDIASHNPFIDRIYPIEPYDATTLDTSLTWAKYYKKTPRIEDELFWQKADLKIDLNCSCVSYEWPAMMSPEGIQKPRYQVWCEAAGVIPSSYKPIYVIKKDERRWASDFYAERNWDPAKCVAVAVSSCDPRRAIGHRKLRAICTGIREMGYRPVIIDPTFHWDDIDYINGKRISELMPLLEQMRLAVSADSGLLHMAGTVGTPVVGIFGPTDAKMRMGMYLGSAVDSTKLMPCAPCWYKYPCVAADKPVEKQFECLNRLGADVILDEIARWLARPRNLTNLRVY